MYTQQRNIYFNGKIYLGVCAVKYTNLNKYASTKVKGNHSFKDRQEVVRGVDYKYDGGSIIANK